MAEVVSRVLKDLRARQKELQPLAEETGRSSRPLTPSSRPSDRLMGHPVEVPGASRVRPALAAGARARESRRAPISSSPWCESTRASRSARPLNACPWRPRPCTGSARGSSRREGSPGKASEGSFPRPRRQSAGAHAGLAVRAYPVAIAPRSRARAARSVRGGRARARARSGSEARGGAAGRAGRCRRRGDTACRAEPRSRGGRSRRASEAPRAPGRSHARYRTRGKGDPRPSRVGPPRRGSAGAREPTDDRGLPPAEAGSGARAESVAAGAGHASRPRWSRLDRDTGASSVTRERQLSDLSPRPVVSAPPARSGRRARRRGDSDVTTSPVARRLASGWRDGLQSGISCSGDKDPAPPLPSRAVKGALVLASIVVLAAGAALGGYRAALTQSALRRVFRSAASYPSPVSAALRRPYWSGIHPQPQIATGSAGTIP